MCPPQGPMSLFPGWATCAVLQEDWEQLARLVAVESYLARGPALGASGHSVPVSQSSRGDLAVSPKILGNCKLSSPSELPQWRPP